MATLSPQQRQSVSRISGLVLINALVFQEVLAEHNSQVKPIQKILNSGHHISGFSKQWKYILTNINFYPIFHVSVQILENLSTNKSTTNAIEKLANTAQTIVSYRAALRHDLMGRVYHRLLAEAKYLGTYYTSIPAATLLLKLALRQEGQAQITEDFRVADLACGTGTLLMAAADGITDLDIRARSSRDEEFDLADLHKTLSEKIIHGYDVLASAIHLTASTLALRAPQVSFKKMNLISLPLGGPHLRLGSIEFLDDRYVSEYTDLFGAVKQTDAEQVTGTESKKLKNVTIPPLDLCIMNPPFTRSVGGNLLFGSLPDEQRKKMQKRLAALIKKKKALANSTAGLGSVFVALADRFIKQGGTIGLVLPKTILSGVAWDKTRQLLRDKYKVEYIVASHDPERWNFSENTDLSEVLLVARKKKNKETNDGQVIVVNLWQNPTTTFEALAIHSAVPNTAPSVEKGQGSYEVKIGNDKIGEAIGINWIGLKSAYQWMLPSAFGQTDLIRVTNNLIDGKFQLPASIEIKLLTLSKLENLGTLGPDRRDIHDGFSLSKNLTAYPAFWSHHTDDVFCLAQTANKFLSPLGRAKNGRHLRKVSDLWPLAGKVLIVERLGLNTHRLVALRTSERLLSNVWWTFSFSSAEKNDDYEKALVLWLNSTLGLLILLANREETHGPWIGFKKPVLAAMPVLSVIDLSDKQLQKLTSAYDKLSTQLIHPFPNMDKDEVRAAIDTSVAEALGLPDFSVLRTLLAQEPVVCLKRL